MKKCLLTNIFDAMPQDVFLLHVKNKDKKENYKSEDIYNDITPHPPLNFTDILVPTTHLPSFMSASPTVATLSC